MPKVFRIIAGAPAILATVVFVVFGFVCADAQTPAATSQSGRAKTGESVAKAPEKKALPYILEIRKYRRAKYFRLGPVVVSDYAANKLTLRSGQGKRVIDLSGKKLTVKNKAAVAVSPTMLKKGTVVYLCSKDKDVVIYVLGMNTAGTRKGE